VHDPCTGGHAEASAMGKVLAFPVSFSGGNFLWNF
jgi:hypothetical protein